MRLLALHIALLAFVGIASAQFGGFFDQMFGHGHGHQQQRQRQEPQDSPSDASQYRHAHAQIRCSNYVCPDTLACVHFPHHCPCAWPQEDKFELADGQRICVSKGGFKEGEAARKVELARKGML